MATSAIGYPEEIQKQEHDPTTEHKKVDAYGWDGSNAVMLKVDSDGELAINLQTSDIEIGAVEIKDNDSDDRVVVEDFGAGLGMDVNILADGDKYVQGTEAEGATISDNPVLVGTEKIDGTLTSLKSNKGGSALVDLGNGTKDSFGHIVTGSINNFVDIQFYRDTPANLVTVTTANGGTATASGGMATFATTTTASSRAKGVTTETTTYTGGAEVYSIFTAGFTNSGTEAGTTSYRRIGLYTDGGDGFYIGYEAATGFGVTILKGGSATRTLQANFSEDDLSGGATSLFTRAGTPEAIDLEKLNVWRIRFGWVGSAPIKFEVLSPDGDWVTFHTIHQPNLAALPSIETADLPVTCDVFTGDASRAYTIITNCWVAGTTQSLVQLNGNRTLLDTDYAQLTRSVITGENSSAGGSYVNVKVNPSGTLEVNANQGTHDNLNANANVQQGNADVSSTNELYVRGSGTAGSADAAVLSIQGIASMTPVQIADNSGSITVDNGGTFATQATLQTGTNAIGKLNPPDIDVTAHTNYIRKYYTASTPTDGIIWSPAAGKRWHVLTMAINVSAASTVTVEDDKSGGDDPVYKAEFAANSGVVLTFPEKYPMASGEDAADLTITASAGTVYVTVVGYEV